MKDRSIERQTDERIDRWIDRQKEVYNETGMYIYREVYVERQPDTET